MSEHRFPYIKLMLQRANRESYREYCLSEQQTSARWAVLKAGRLHRHSPITHSRRISGQTWQAVIQAISRQRTQKHVGISKARCAAMQQSGWKKALFHSRDKNQWITRVTHPGQIPAPT
jgi:hypothetical protein